MAVSACLVDFGRYVLHNAATLLEQQQLLVEQQRQRRVKTQRERYPTYR
jgi:hypothetical protein